MGSILVTGAAGFIGYHVAARLTAEGETVMGVDNLSPYYDVRLKHTRLQRLQHLKDFSFTQLDLADADAVRTFFRRHRFDCVIHLAAQPGVRSSLVNPHAYISANVVGFLNVLEGCRTSNVRHLVFASSSSVYGANRRLPFSAHDITDHPVSLYAATKKSGELMAHTYAHIFGIPCTGLRFFTVYGPWGRPDMMPMLFARAILEERPIELFNFGRHKRDFTYIDDVVEGVVRIMKVLPQPNPTWNSQMPDPAISMAPYRLYNIGNHTSVELLEFVALLEQNLGKPAKKNMLPMQPGDVEETCADVDDLSRAIGFVPSTSLEVGVKKFVEWYVEYYSTAALSSGETKSAAL